MLPTVLDPSRTSAVAESFPVCPVPSVKLASVESVVVVEPSLEESVVVEESAGGEESEVGVPKSGAVEELGGEEESDVNVLLEESVEESGAESMTGCPEPVTVSYTGTVINASIQQSGICRGWCNIGPRQKSYRIRNN